MKVRRASVEDAVVIASLGTVLQQMHYEERPDWFKPADEIVFTEMYRHRLMDPTVTAFISEQDDVAVGFVVAEVQVRTDSRPPCVSHPRSRLTRDHPPLRTRDTP